MRSGLPLTAFLALLPALAAAGDFSTPDVRFKSSAGSTADKPVKGKSFVRTKFKEIAADCRVTRSELMTIWNPTEWRYSESAGKLVNASYHAFGRMEDETKRGGILTPTLLRGLADFMKKKGHGRSNTQWGMKVAVMGFWSKLPPGGLSYTERLTDAPTSSPVVTKYSPNARVYDGNFSRKLDEGDCILLPDGDGFKLHSDRLPSHWANEISSTAELQDSIVKAARRMIKVKHKFAGPVDTKWNDCLWRPGPDKAGKLIIRDTNYCTNKPNKASEAVEDVIKSSSKYAFECSMGVKFAYLLGLKDFMGDGDFDKAFKGAWVQPGPPQEPPLKHVVAEFGLGRARTLTDPTEESKFIGKLQKGDWVYVNSQGACDAMRNAHWSGENMLYLGSDRFFAHGPDHNDTTVYEVKDHIEKVAQSMCGRVPIHPGLIDQKRALSTNDVLSLWRKSLPGLLD